MIKTYTLGGQPVRVDTNLMGRNLLARIKEANADPLEKRHAKHRHWGFMGHLVSWYPTRSNGKCCEAIELFAFDLDTKRLVPLPGGESCKSYPAACTFIKNTLGKARAVVTRP